MGQSVEVVVSELHSAAARLESAAQRLQDGLSAVDNETTQLLGSGWKGEAASAYGPAWQQWHDGAGQVVQGLQRMSELLTIAGKEYAKTDEQASGALGSSMQGPGGSGGSTTGGHETGQSGGSSGDDMAQQMNLADQQTPASQMGQMAQPLAQAGQAVAGLPQQAGQAIAGLAQQAVQLAAGLAQQAGQAETGGDDSSAPKDDQRGDESEERGDEPEGPGGAAPSEERPAGSAPVSTEPVRRDETTGAVERPGE